MPRSEAVRRTALRWLFLTHRWVGIAACALFVMWFASGLVMLYVPYPALSPAMRWAGAAPIDWTKVDAPVPMGAGRVGLSLEMRDDEPVWRIERDDGTIGTRPARQGAVLPAVDDAYARRTATAFAHQRALSVERLMRDQWTVAGGFDRHRPLWKVALDDPARTELYVSSSTGLPVQRTTRTQRVWNWLGSIPHWLYPTVLRRDDAAWRQVVMWVSGPCIAVALTGMWIGILRARFGRRRYRAGRISPYRGWMVWHHVSGLIGGMFLLCWIVSGWLSVDPGRMFAGTAAPPGALRRYRALDTAPTISLARLAALAPDARTVEIVGASGVTRIVIDRASAHRLVLDAATMAPPDGSDAGFARSTRPLVAGGQAVAYRSPDSARCLLVGYGAAARPSTAVRRSGAKLAVCRSGDGRSDRATGPGAADISLGVRPAAHMGLVVADRSAAVAGRPHLGDVGLRPDRIGERGLDRVSTDDTMRRRSR